MNADKFPLNQHPGIRIKALESKLADATQEKLELRAALGRIAESLKNLVGEEHEVSALAELKQLARGARAGKIHPRIR